MEELDQNGSTPLHESFRREAPLEVQEYLLSKYPSAIGRKDSRGRTALHAAMCYQKDVPLHLIKMIVEHCPIVVETGDSHDTLPLHFAAWGTSDLDVVQFLAEKHQEALSRKDTFSGWTPLHSACAPTWSGRSSLEIVKFLVTRQPEMVREVDRNGFNPLHLACSEHPACEPNKFSLGVVDYLSRMYPELLKVKSCRGKLPLHLACEWNAPLGIITTLVERYPDALKVKDEDTGWTPMHHICEAAACGRDVKLSTVRVLAERHPVCDKDDKGRTPFDVMSEILERSERGKCAIEACMKMSCERAPDILEIFRHMSLLNHIASPNLDKSEVSEALDTMISLKWPQGVTVFFDFYPLSLCLLPMDDLLMPDILSVIGRRCSLDTMWEVVRNKSNILGKKGELLELLTDSKKKPDYFYLSI
uniref:Ankyrin repeat protein n=1 Tax=Odontella aurita TaxID=265563 RepID=A0A7S4JW64_9STRA